MFFQFLQTLKILAKKIEHRRNQRLTRPQFEKMQLTKFRKLMRHLKAHSPYYAKTIEQNKIDIDHCTPQDFPVMTKSLLMENFDQISTDPRLTKKGVTDFLSRSHDPSERYLDKFYVIHTSGSSGEVGIFVYSGLDWASGISHSVNLRSRPFSFSPSKISFYGATEGHFGGISIASTAKQGSNKLLYHLQALEINAPFAETVKALNDFQPDRLAGYPTGIKMLAEKQKEGVLKIRPRTIEMGGEPLTEEDRLLLSKTFGAEVRNIYASSEFMFMGIGLPNLPAMRLCEDDLIFEFFEDHTLVTSLFNTTLPLIRYRMNDILRIREKSDLSSPYQEIDSIVGRSERVPKFINHHGTLDFISPHTINEIFVSGISRFQMRVLNDTSFRFLVCLENGLDNIGSKNAVDGITERLRYILKQKEMENVEFQVAVADHLAIDPITRKFRLIMFDGMP